MMLYPQKINARKTNFIIKMAILISFAVGVGLVLINQFTTPDIKWAGYCNAGIVYVWITVLYALNKNVNIASHLFIQMVALVLASLVPIFLVYEHLVNDKTLSIVASGISGFNLLMSLIFHFKDIKEEVVRKFHI